MRLLRNSRGQAVFELIIFLPFLVFLITVVTTIGNSINGSINQQKATRGYFYRLIKGNSMSPSLPDLNALSGINGNLSRIGAFTLGWREKSSSNGQSAFATCYKFTNLFSQDSGETCEEPLNEEQSSQFVRIYTFYGLCGQTYSRGDGPDFFIDNLNTGTSSCTVQ